MIRIIFSDMDGTLLDENGNLPSEFGEVMLELKRRGVIFAPASGRQYFALLEQLAPYRDDFMFLAENGAFSVYKGQEICSSPMAADDIRQIIAAADAAPGIYPILCGKRNAYVREEWNPYIGEARKYFTHSIVVDDFESIDDEFIKVALCDCDRADAEHNILPIMKKCVPDLQVCLSGNYWVDVLNPGANKGWAIKQVQQQFGFRPEECAAFGDYMNDYEMMKSVYYSYAMDNAYPEIKDAARFVTKSNIDHGVIYQIKELMAQGLIGE
ncbi:MAG: Cof-type HAD-IIB family hydrolase [Anaerovibrio sp.]|uniref:HAD family hydrolase n=1 Tax=Anaerovibrio sp. TaxID=1872532 RepID=UPI0025E94BD2|nr:HAD family hydrolase [Anaerovibrio sp.]MCR5175644.1 Cof-type HAD-IIB family hydrolase [Anaerovibrio sp.]